MRWGMTGFEQQEQTRPQYQGIRHESSTPPAVAHGSKFGGMLGQETREPLTENETFMSYLEAAPSHEVERV